MATRPNSTANVAPTNAEIARCRTPADGVGLALDEHRHHRDHVRPLHQHAEHDSADQPPLARPNELDSMATEPGGSCRVSRRRARGASRRREW
jgi:hypothetical protein